jgi:2-isopropylmalate synthase
MTRPGARPVRLIDATLREGAQAPGVAFDVEASCAIASALARLGVDAVECGHPAQSEAERARVRAVVDLGLSVPVLAHARAHARDVDAVKDSGAAWVGLFLGVNETSRRHRIPGRTLEELLEVIAEAVRYARAAGLEVRFTVEDASRTPLDELVAAYRVAAEAGAGRLCVADTVGVLDPPGAAALVAAVGRALPGLPLEVHFHDDRGLALANALAAADAGATWVSCAVNGVGERCGIVDTAVLLANLQFRAQRTLADPALLQETSGLVARAAGLAVHALHPVTGAHAFTHRARLHVLAMERDPASYSWTEPASLGRKPTLMPVDGTGSKTD